MQPEESSRLSETHLKFFLQPPLSLEQSLTGPNDASRSSTVSKCVDIMASSLETEHRRARVRSVQETTKRDEITGSTAITGGHAVDTVTFTAATNTAKGFKEKEGGKGGVKEQEESISNPLDTCRHPSAGLRLKADTVFSALISVIWD